MADSSRKVVVLGMLAKMPVPGVAWQTLHYLLGLRRLGFDPYYVETHARTPSMLMERETDDATARAGRVIDDTLRPYGLGGRWAFHALHDDGRVLGLSERELARVLRDAELLINLHGGTEPREELAGSGRLVYLETDPVQLQIELHDGLQSARDFLAPHCAFFTFAENLGGPDCTLPCSAEFPFRPTRQPVVLDLWDTGARGPGAAFRTIGNWHQGWRSVRFDGETYGWSKDAEWRKFLKLPERTGEAFELALSGHAPRHEEELRRLGFGVRPALDFNFDLGAYRDFIAGARGEFTVAKDQNIRFRTGWFSDRSATFLAAGRAVVTQDTAFGSVLPTGEGLFAVTDLDEAVDAIGRIAADPARHGRAAAEIAREHFDAERVLGRLMTDMGVTLNRRSTMREPRATDHTTGTGERSHAPRLHRDCTVLALIPHFECEQYLDDCLAALTAQTRPLDGIVVIDDVSAEPPIDIVKRYPNVTLLRAAENSGPYRLVQTVMNQTDYDAYLFQDADDWSAPDRLWQLLEHAEATGADMIGSQEVRIFCDEPEVAPIQWPLDGNAPFKERPTAFPLLHPTTLVSKHIMQAAGGYSMALRFGGDAEFLRRVHHVGRCVNSPHHGYFRRVRQGSLTTAPATAIGTPARKQLMEETFARASANAERVARGEQPDLTPLRPGPPVKLERLCGPRLHTKTSGSRRPRPAAPEQTPRVEGAPAPVFVVGAERSGASVLAAALGQHPSIALSQHGGWLAGLAGTLRDLRDAALAQDPATFGVQPPSPSDLAAAFGPAASALAGGTVRHWVDGSWQLSEQVPGARRALPRREVHPRRAGRPRRGAGAHRPAARLGRRDGRHAGPRAAAREGRRAGGRGPLGRGRGGLPRRPAPARGRADAHRVPRRPDRRSRGDGPPLHRLRRRGVRPRVPAAAARAARARERRPAGGRRRSRTVGTGARARRAGAHGGGRPPRAAGPGRRPVAPDRHGHRPLPEGLRDVLRPQVPRPPAPGVGRARGLPALQRRALGLLPRAALGDPPQGPPARRAREPRGARGRAAPGHRPLRLRHARPRAHPHRPSGRVPDGDELPRLRPQLVPP
jgi:hypothetical protein